MDSLDFTQWPVWLVAFLLILNLFKTPLANLFPIAFGFLTARAKARAQIEEMEAEGQRQDEVTEKLMLTNLVQQFLTQNRELIDFIKAIIVGRLDILDARLDAIEERLISIANEHRSLCQKYEKVVNGD